MTTNWHRGMASESDALIINCSQSSTEILEQRMATHRRSWRSALERNKKAKDDASKDRQDVCSDYILKRGSLMARQLSRA